MEEKDPFLTRAELRQKIREMEHSQKQEQQRRQKESEREFLQREQEIDRFYRKEFKKKQPIKQTRSGEKQKSRRMSSFLGKAIGVVFVLIVIVVLAIIFI